MQLTSLKMEAVACVLPSIKKDIMVFIGLKDACFQVFIHELLGKFLLFFFCKGGGVVDCYSKPLA